jgi:sulfopyruvate decarboxylase subunit alpha
VTLAREEEGIGICAGAYMGGLTPAIIMQNGGFLNSCNALTTTALNFNIPILLLIYYAGDLGDEGFSMLGSVTEPVLRGIGIRYQVLRRLEEIKRIIKGASTLAIDSRRPVAVLLTKDVLGM